MWILWMILFPTLPVFAILHVFFTIMLWFVRVDSGPFPTNCLIVLAPALCSLFFLSSFFTPPSLVTLVLAFLCGIPFELTNSDIISLSRVYHVYVSGVFFLVDFSQVFTYAKSENE